MKQETETRRFDLAAFTHRDPFILITASDLRVIWANRTVTERCPHLVGREASGLVQYADSEERVSPESILGDEGAQRKFHIPGAQLYLEGAWLALPNGFLMVADSVPRGAEPGPGELSQQDEKASHLSKAGESPVPLQETASGLQEDGPCAHEYKEQIEKLKNKLENAHTGRKRAEATLREHKELRTNQLKELQCLLSISSLADTPGLPLEEIITSSLTLIPTSWQYPRITCARILLDGKEFKTDRFRETPWMQKADILVHGKPAGAIEVCYLEERPECGDGPFLEEEKILLESVAAQLGRIITLKKAEKELQEKEKKYRLLVENMPQNVFYKDKNSVYISCNRKYAQDLKIEPGKIGGKTDYDFFPQELAEKYRSDDKRIISSGESEVLEEKYAPNGRELLIRTLRTPVRNSQGDIVGILGISQDITEQKELEQELLQARKLEAVGQLAAGIAHEVNTPTQYIGDNTHFLQDSFTELLDLFEKYEQLRNAAKRNNITAQLLEELHTAVEETDVPYLREEIPKSIQQSLNGIERITKIVAAMKEFSHPGIKEKTPSDINKAVENAVTITRNEWKYVAEVKTDLDPELPQVSLLSGEFNQVLLNLITNAAHAIASVLEQTGQEKGTITITTKRAGDWAEVRIADTGAGIPEGVRHRIFDPFFTTKEVGKGTGQGLSLSRSVIVDKHGGKITFETAEGKGTTFIIRLPIASPEGE